MFITVSWNIFEYVKVARVIDFRIDFANSHTEFTGRNHIFSWRFEKNPTIRMIFFVRRFSHFELTQSSVKNFMK